MPGPPMFDARLTRTRMLSASVRELTFKREDGAPMTHEPGQWISLILPLQTGEARRSYSIASAPRHDGLFEIAVTHVKDGPGSTFLHDLKEGAVLRAIGPQGFFTRDKDVGASLFVATGTGVTPLRSMLHAARDRGDAANMVLLFGVRHEEDRLYQDELAELTKALPHLRVEYTISQAAAAWTGRTGYVQTHVRALYDELAKDGAAPHVYICGLKKMIDAVRDLLKNEMKLPRQHVHSERYD